MAESQKASDDSKYGIKTHVISPGDTHTFEIAIFASRNGISDLCKLK